MEVSKMMELLAKAYEGIQNLAIQPTATNVELLGMALNAVKTVYRELDGMKREPEEPAEDSGEEACGEDGPEE